MGPIQNYMTEEHRNCDSTYAYLEEAILEDDPKGAKDYSKKLSAELNTHLKREEDVLFPAFEKVTGSEMGPTQMMRMEHTQIRDLLKKIDMAVDSGLTKDSKKNLIGLLETLMILLQQHNMKEEQILYPMTEDALGDKCDEVLASMKQV
jgi:iron-sulfur cluster repair protein YtfE (RIC family)